jgi:hypothetical protein
MLVNPCAQGFTHGVGLLGRGNSRLWLCGLLLGLLGLFWGHF